MKLQGVKTVKADEFKFLVSTTQTNRLCTREMKKRLQAGWMEWEC